MEGGKKAIVVGGLLVVIVGAAYFALRQAGFGSKPTPPNWVMQQKMEKIDKDTLEVMTLTLEEWADLGQDKEARFKNPNTGEYTMVPTMECASCGEKIPMPDLPSNPTEATRIMRDYTCPRCGEPAYSEESSLPL